MKEKEKNNKEIEREGGERGNPYEAALLEDVPFSAFHPSRSLQLPRTNADGCDWTRGLGSALPPFFLPIALPLLHLHTHTRGRALLGSWCILAPAETAIAFRRPFFSHYILSSPSGVFVRYIALPISSIRLSNFFIFYLCIRFQLSPSPPPRLLSHYTHKTLDHRVNANLLSKSNEVSSQKGHCFQVWPSI